MERPRPVLKLTGPLDVRSTSLAALAILSFIYFLRTAQAVFIPVALAVVTACALAPLVSWLRQRARIPKPLGAAAILLLLCGLLGLGINSLQPQIMRILDVVPQATAKFSQAMRESARNNNGALQKINRAATEIERAAVVANAPGTVPPRALPKTPPAPAAAPINVRDYIMMGTASAVGAMGQFVVVLSLVFFLLISGDTFRYALVRACGESLSKRRTALRVTAEVVGQIQRYLGIQLVTSALLGVVVGVIFAVLGLQNAVFWASCGALLHMIPYIGPAVFIVVVAMVSYVQFHTLVPVVAVVLGILVSTGIIGMLLVPWLTQRVGRLNAVTVFVTLLFWGWLWGVWGLLLGIPIVMALNVICGHVQGLQVISHFLSASPRERPERKFEKPSEAATEHGAWPVSQ